MNPLELRIGKDVITATRPDADSPYRDFDFNSAGYLKLNDPGLDFFRSSGQGNFADPTAYYKWLYGGGNVVTGSDNQQYFQTPNGVGNTVNQSLSYNPADTLWDNLGLYLVGGIAGAGALAGMGGAGAAAGGIGEIPVGAAGAFDMGGLAGGVPGAGGATGWTAAGGLPTAGGAASGFNWTDPSTWFGNTPPTPTGLSGGDAGSIYDGGTPNSFGGGITSGATGGSGMDLSSLFSGGNLLNFAGQGLSGLLQFLGSKQAAEIQSQYGQQALALIAQQMAQNQANAQPWINAGTAGLNNAGGLLGLPGYDAVDFTKTPGYQFRYDEGMKQLQNQLRAGGNFYSGDALKGTQQYAQNFATNEFSNALNRDLALAGMGQTSVGNLGSLNTTGTNNAANMLTGIGNVEAAGRASGYNALGGAIGGALNTYNQNNLLTALLGRGY